MVATSPLASGHETRRMAEFFTIGLKSYLRPRGILGGAVPGLRRSMDQTVYSTPWQLRLRSARRSMECSVWRLRRLSVQQLKRLPGRIHRRGTRPLEGLPGLHPKECSSLPAAVQVDPSAPSPSYFLRCFKISLAAFAPDPPVKPAPGCVPLPQRYRFSIGVR